MPDQSTADLPGSSLPRVGDTGSVQPANRLTAIVRSVERTVLKGDDIVSLRCGFKAFGMELFHGITRPMNSIPDFRMKPAQAERCEVGMALQIFRLTDA